jgi:hypothetical protein
VYALHAIAFTAPRALTPDRAEMEGQTLQAMHVLAIAEKAVFVVGAAIVIRRSRPAIVLGMVAALLAMRLSIGPAVSPVPVALPAPVAFPLNNALAHASSAFPYELHGAKSFALGPDGRMYTSLSDGRVVRFDPQTVSALETVAKTGKNITECGSYAVEPECGRPMGLAFGPDGHPFCVRCLPRPAAG